MTEYNIASHSEWLASCSAIHASGYFPGAAAAKLPADHSDTVFPEGPAGNLWVTSHRCTCLIILSATKTAPKELQLQLELRAVHYGIFSALRRNTLGVMCGGGVWLSGLEHGTCSQKGACLKPAVSRVISLLGPCGRPFAPNLSGWPYVCFALYLLGLDNVKSAQILRSWFSPSAKGREASCQGWLAE